MASLFHNRWWMVFATICGLVVGAGPINVFTFGVFLKPITEDLGLSRGAFSAALTFHAAIAAIVLPIIGWPTARPQIVANTIHQRLWNRLAIGRFLDRGRVRPDPM